MTKSAMYRRYGTPVMEISHSVSVLTSVGQKVEAHGVTCDPELSPTLTRTIARMPALMGQMADFKSGIHGFESQRHLFPIIPGTDGPREP